jgi:uncharacterized membrane protein
VAQEIGCNIDRVRRETAVLIGAHLLERHRSHSEDLGLLRLTEPEGVRWAAAGFPPIGTLGSHHAKVSVSLQVEVRTVLQEVQTAAVDPTVLEQYELRLRRVEEELAKPDGQGRLQTVHDLVETANGSKDLLIPTLGFLATHADKIKTFAEGVGNLLT